MTERWADMLEQLPTITQAQTCDLKVDTGEYRVWLARTGPEDGELFRRTVYVEEMYEGRWRDAGVYNGELTERDSGRMGHLLDVTRHS